MSSVQSPIYEYWECCISATMFLRGRCHNRPYLYITESGSMALDARPVNKDDETIINAIAVICSLIAEDYDFSLDYAYEFEGLYIWKKINKEDLV